MIKELKLLALLFMCTMNLCACQTLENMKNNAYDVAEGDIYGSGIKNNIYLAEIIGSTPEKLLRSPCPKVEIVDDLSSISDFSSPHHRNKENLISRVDLKSAESACNLSSKTAIVDLKLLFNGTLGPKGRNKTSEKPFFSYPFFVAVTTPTGKIMAKEIFAASITYASGENEHTYFENLRQIIPIKNKNKANNYRILIGFQVTPDQLAYNRKHMVPIASAEAAKKRKPDPPKDAEETNNATNTTAKEK
ncbi:MAG: hypothetical protein KAJ40_04610 [Alphaproteobacteria bacterium]|nr:hypothetical protein [Alphaproteobacteria bacterium]